MDSKPRLVPSSSNSYGQYVASSSNNGSFSGAQLMMVRRTSCCFLIHYQYDR